jgi:hypothetical protein
MDYLVTEALPAFIPSNWTGVNGIEPLIKAQVERHFTGQEKASS